MCSSKRRGEENCGNKSINIDFLEDLIWLHVIAEGKFRDAARQYFDEQRDSDFVKDLEAEITRLNYRKQNLSVERQNLMKAVRGKALTLDDIKSEIHSIRIGEQDVDNKLGALEEQKLAYTKSIEDVDSILTDLDIDKDSEHSFLDKRALLQRHIDTIRIFYSEEWKHYYIEINPKLKGMKPVVYAAPYSKKYAWNLLELTDQQEVNELGEVKLSVYLNELDSSASLASIQIYGVGDNYIELSGYNGGRL